MKSSSKYFTTIIFFFILAIIVVPVYSSPGNRLCSWHHISFGVNPYNFKNERSANGHGFTIGYTYSLQRNSNNFISFQLSRSFEVPAPFAPYHSPLESLNEVALLYGKPSNNKHLHLSFTIGLGVIAGINRGKWLGTIGSESYSCEKLAYYSIGIPMELQLNSNASGSCGVGLRLFGNINFEQPIWGLALLFKIGKQENSTQDQS
ncbi:MAG TPA: hypothetical protein PKY55_03905 [bacterium]|nr:hypothetical protein [bacterium]